MSRVYETAIKIGATISKAFGADAKNAADGLKKLAAATKQLKTAEKAAASFKKLDDEVGRSKARLDNASAALKRLEEAERAAGGATKESTQWRKAGARAVATASRQFDRATKAAGKNAEVLQKLGVDTSKITSEQERLTRALAATERQEKSLGRYEAARERLFGARSKTPLFQKAGEQVRGLASEAMLLGTAAAGVGIGLFEIVRRTGEAGDAAAKMAKRVGIGVTSLQELRYAGQRTGATAEEVDNAVGKMLINIGKWKVEGRGKGGESGPSIPGLQMLKAGKTSSAGGSTLDPFKMLGINAAKLSALKPEEQIDQIADAMGKLKTNADRAAVAQAIFGREGGLKLIPLMKGGAAGIAQLRQQARELGYVISEDAAKQAEEFHDSMLDAEMAATGLANTLGVALLPVVTDTFKQFTGWVKTNRVEIKKWVGDAATWIENKGIPALKNITAEAQSFGAKVLWLVEVAAKLTGGFGNLALVVAGLRIAPLAVTFGKIGIETYKAASALFRYVAASQAAKAAGGIPGMEAPALSTAGKAIGLAASAAMVVGALAIGYQIGTALDNYFGLSDKLGGWLSKATGQDKKLKGIEDTGVQAHDYMLKSKEIERANRVTQYESQGLSHGQALYAADHGGPATATPRTGARHGGVHVAPVINIHPRATRDDVAKGMDHAKAAALAAVDKRDAHRKRVSYAE